MVTTRAIWILLVGIRWHLAGFVACALFLDPSAVLAQVEFGGLYGSVTEGSGTLPPGVSAAPSPIHSLVGWQRLLERRSNP